MGIGGGLRSTQIISTECASKQQVLVDTYRSSSKGSPEVAAQSGNGQAVWEPDRARLGTFRGTIRRAAYRILG